MALGLSCVQLIARRWALLDVFYTESGAYPRSVLEAGASWQAGPLFWVTSPAALHLIFAACFLVAVAFTAGFCTRYVRWLLAPALIAIDGRIPLIFTGGEAVLHAQAIYVALMPVGTAWSVDAWRRARRGPPSQSQPPTAIQTPLYALLLVQLSAIYLFCALAKFGESWQDGSAVARSLGCATLVTELGSWVLHLPAPILRMLTYGTRIVEGSLPLWLLSPWGRRYLHPFAAALMLALHGGIFLTMEVGSFSVAMLCFLPLLWHPRELEQNVLVRPLRARRIEAMVVAFLSYLVMARLSHDLILWPDRPKLPLPLWLERVTTVAGFVQPWMMFSPDPPERDFIIVTDAVTRKGAHLDPWRAVAGGPVQPLERLPPSVVKKHVFTRYEGDLSTSNHTYLHPFFSRWVLAQRGPDGEPVERFDSWLMVVSTLPGEVLPADELDQHMHVSALPFTDALPIKTFEARGVWTPERAIDHKIVPEGTYVLNPVAANMSAGCPHFTLDLGQAHALKSVYLQADAADYFGIDGSLDGQSFERLAEMPRLEAGHYRSRVIELPGKAVRFVRVQPMKSRGMSHFLSEIALFDHAVSLPPLAEDNEHQFVSALDRPAVAGIVSGSNHPSPECPAENAPLQMAEERRRRAQR